MVRGKNRKSIYIALSEKNNVFITIPISNLLILTN